MKEFLSIKGLSIQYNTDSGIVYAVNDLSLEIYEGETLGLVGETGAGKTTTALGIIGLIQCPPGQVSSGRIVFRDEDIRRYSPSKMRKIRGSEISMIFQDPMTALNPAHKIGKQIEEVIRLHQKTSRTEAVHLAAEMLKMVGIQPERMNEYPHQFSGGMKQRVVIAMALACHPALLIADEPTTALDVTIQAQVMGVINRLKRDLQTSMLMITHDLGLVVEICDRVAIMYAGEIIEIGSLYDIYEKTAHPYTLGLFASLPSLEEDKKRLQPIRGSMPDPTKLITGCKFANRCNFCKSKCTEIHPSLTRISGEHYVRCFYPSNRGR